ncbi:MAG: hypothetical protein M3Y34_02545 [Actinomycetota bacterium]|nr:hypothetical protein [Actinomycetota bacterium]
MTALAALAFILAAVPAGAGVPKAESEISYRNYLQTSTFIHKGKVRSESAKCVKKRTVELYGEGFEKPFERQLTNAKGRYKFIMKQDSIAGDYYTRVTRKVKASVVCKAAESKHKPLA